MSELRTVEVKLTADTSGVPTPYADGSDRRSIIVSPEMHRSITDQGNSIAEVIVDELEQTRAERMRELLPAQRRLLDRQLTAERKRRRRGGTPADAAALEAAEAKRDRKRARNLDRA